MKPSTDGASTAESEVLLIDIKSPADGASFVESEVLLQESHAKDFPVEVLITDKASNSMISGSDATKSAEMFVEEGAPKSSILIDIKSPADGASFVESEVLLQESHAKDFPEEVLITDKASNSMISASDATKSAEIFVEEGAPKSSMYRRLSVMYMQYKDRKGDMTYSRMIAQRLMEYKWYYPHNDPPNDRLKHAWEYFEHVILPRYLHWEPTTGESTTKLGFFGRIRHSFSSSSIGYERARAHEANPTKLYPSFGLGLDQMQGFGIGIFLYFSMLKYLVALTFFAGLLNISTMQYFGSSAYDDTPGKNLPFLIRWSSICSKTVWVPCLHCSSANFSDVEDYRWGIADTHHNSTLLNLDLSSNSDSKSGTRYRYNDMTIDHVGNSSITYNTTLNALGDNNSNFTTSPNQSAVKVDLFFSLKNDCGGDFYLQGVTSLCTIIMMVVGVMYINNELEGAEVTYDEMEQTAQDYSIVIHNPPFDANDPEEWKEFFSHFDGAEVACCTISFDNDLLINSLAARRDGLKRIEMMVEPGSSMDDNNLARIAAEMEENRPIIHTIIAILFHPFGLLYDVPALYAKVVVLTAKIKGISQRNYKVTRVYATFETEKDQRYVLSTLAVPIISAMFNKGINNRNHLFRGALVLRVEEAPEPEAIRWENLNTDSVEKVKLSVVINSLSFGLVMLIFFAIQSLQGYKPAYVPYLITALNLIFPLFAKIFTNFEKHETETDIQSSLFFKTLIFRLITTVVILYIITEFSATLGETGIILSVQKIFMSEIITANALAIGDPAGHIKRHLLGPRQKIQDRMNRYFLGKPVQLAERYSTQAKLLILSATYFVIYPQSLLLCSLALFINYHIDKFCMLRSWSLPARLEATTSKIFRKFFSPILFMTLAFCSAYWWAGFPFDKLCPDGKVGEFSRYIGNHVINTKEINGDEKKVNVTVKSGDDLYQFCAMDMLKPFRFPPLPREQCRAQDYGASTYCTEEDSVKWMTEEQERVTTIFGWFLTGMTIISLLFILYHIYMTFRGYFHASKFVGEDQGVSFSSVPFITTYIPQVTGAEFSYPLLACSIDEIDPSLMTWTDPHKPYSFYSLLNDAKEILGLDDANAKDAFNRVFDRVKHWPKS